MEKKVNYGSEIAVLEVIEKILNIQFPVFSEQIKWNDFGVFIQDNLIHGIGFYSQKMQLIPDELWNLQNLKVLNLVNNGIIGISQITVSLNTRIVKLRSRVLHVRGS